VADFNGLKLRAEEAADAALKDSLEQALDTGKNRDGSSQARGPSHEWVPKKL